MNSALLSTDIDHDRADDKLRVIRFMKVVNFTSCSEVPTA